MKIAFSPTIQDYIEKVEDLLLRKEASNNLILGLIDYYKTTISKDVYFGYVEDEGEIIYAFMQTPPNNWILPDIAVEKNIIENIATFLYKKAMKVPGVLGPEPKVEVFVNEWKSRKKVNAKVHMNQLIYQLVEVKVNIATNGKMIKATKADHTLIKSWLIHFGKEANEPMTEIKADQMATKYIENGTVHLWVVDGVPVSMANQSRRTKNGASINAVYTPGEHKRNGYATNLVALLSRKILNDGFDFCCLYTDRDNPTSNSIYKKIGYYEVGSSVVYEFYN